MQESENVVESVTEKISKLQVQCKETQSKYCKAKRELERANDEILELKVQLARQSAFCVNLGATLSQLTRCSSEDTFVIDSWLSEANRCKVADFLNIVNGSFASFLSTFGNSFPEEASDEHQFLLGLFGSLKNLSSTPEGREFLVTNSDGLEIISNIVKYFPQVPLDQHNSAVLLKELMLTILLYVSVNTNGLDYLLSLRAAGIIAKDCLSGQQQSPSNLLLLSLKFLCSITHELSSSDNASKHLRAVAQDLPLSALNAIARNAKLDDELARLARCIEKNVWGDANTTTSRVS